MLEPSNALSLTVQKASGEYAPFDEVKLRRSLRRSGAKESVIDLILEEVEEKIYPDIPTTVLYKIAYKALKRHNKPTAARYSLKKAMMQLGPSGFPFEKFLAEILKSQGYETAVGEVLKGQCISHEVDIIATKKDELLFVECKYHALQGKTSDVKVPLYIHSRFRDLASTEAVQQRAAGRTIAWMVATNTRFSDDAISYSRCENIQLIAWNYPRENGLRELVDKSGLHPITCLSTLTKSNKSALLEKGIVLCKQLQDSLQIMDQLHISRPRQRNVIQELNGLCL